MSTSCATAAPTRHPPGEAHSLPAPAPLVTTFAAGPLPATTGSEVAARLGRSSPPQSTCRLPSPVSLDSDAATPTRSTTSDSCRQKRIRRHHATRDSTPRRGREPFATGGVPRQASSPVAKGSRPPQRLHHRQAQQLSIEPTASMSAKNHWHSWQTWPTWQRRRRCGHRAWLSPIGALHVGQQQLADMDDTADMADLENQPTSAHPPARVCQKLLADSTRAIKRGCRERPSHERRSAGTVVPGTRRSAARDRFPNTPARSPGGRGCARDSRRR